MNKKDILLSLIDSSATTPYIPAGFFLHFEDKYHYGQAAVDKHLEFFNYTDMDFVKIQYELTFSTSLPIEKPDDWTKIPSFGKEFFENQWQIAKGLIEAAGSEALVIMTLYSPFMCAGQIAEKPILFRHLIDYPEKVIQGLEIITKSLMTFVDGCIEQGIDGFYHSSQGGEAHRFGGSPIFNEFIKPFDLSLMNHVNESTKFNILHICDYHGSYDDLSPFLDYPGDIVNCNLKVGNRIFTRKSLSEMFDRPFMGGLNRYGTIVSGNKDDIQNKIEMIVQESPEKFILGADCTLPGNIDWENIRTAIRFVHSQQPSIPSY